MIQQHQYSGDNLTTAAAISKLPMSSQGFSSAVMVAEEGQHRIRGNHLETLPQPHLPSQPSRRLQHSLQRGISRKVMTLLCFMMISAPTLSFSLVSLSIRTRPSAFPQQRKRAPHRTPGSLPELSRQSFSRLFLQPTRESTTDQTRRMATSDSSSSTVNNSIRGDLIRTGFWVAAAVAFGVFLGVTQGTTTAEEFFAGYLIEQSLSVDNLFVFLLLFESFGVTGAAQQKVLTYGIAGAVVMRAGMIGLGAAALQRFRGILLIFAGILLYSSFNLLTKTGEEEEDEGTNAIIDFSQSVLDTTNEYDGDNFFSTVEPGKATPLLVCMIAVELSDIVFAVDSIPAVFGVTENPWVVFSSNLFAIAGLRSLYSILSQAATDLVYLEKSVALVLGFIGSKMIAETAFAYEIPTNIALLTVATVLGSGIGLSILEKRQGQDNEPTSR